MQLQGTLACSPTLEMGVDVGGLDAVLLRNVPPRPDNYAQRGGGAGRRAHVGLVLGYARNTPHDQYFYDSPAEMIAGEVPAPAVALGNRNVIIRHLNAIAFSISEPGIAGRMVEYVSPPVPGMPRSSRRWSGRTAGPPPHGHGSRVQLLRESSSEGMPVGTAATRAHRSWTARGAVGRPALTPFCLPMVFSPGWQSVAPVLKHSGQREQQLRDPWIRSGLFVFKMRR